VTMYAVRPLGPDAGPDEEAEVIDDFKPGWQFLEQAIALWRLVDEPRAQAIAGIWSRVGEAGYEGESRIEPAEIAELVRLLSGLEEALVTAGIVDEGWRAPLDRLEELGSVVPGMDLRPERPPGDRMHALAEVIANATFVRNFLARALDAGCAVVLG
jgi:glycine/D-amino acid oxidase-like deaminating enzyme